MDDIYIPAEVERKTITAACTTAASSSSSPVDARQAALLLKRRQAARADELTTSAGCPLRAIPDAHADVLFLYDKLAAFNREPRRPRVVYEQGSVMAYGFFEPTGAASTWCSAVFLGTPEQRTVCLVRMSTMGGGEGEPAGDLSPCDDTGGFALRLFTEEGNLDIVAASVPVSPVRNPSLFPDFVHSRNSPNPDDRWDFVSRTPETLPWITACHSSDLSSDLGSNAGCTYRRMVAHGVHTFRWVNKDGVASFVRYKFVPVAVVGGEEKSKERSKLSGLSSPLTGSTDGGGGVSMVRGASTRSTAAKDFIGAIERGECPSWTMSVQQMTFEEATRNRGTGINCPLDPTGVWCDEAHPFVVVGRVVMNRASENQVSDAAAFAVSPGNIVPGIEPTEDRVLRARMFAYPDAQRHRIGVNYTREGVNCPMRGSRPVSGGGGRNYTTGEDVEAAQRTRAEVWGGGGGVGGALEPLPLHGCVGGVGGGGGGVGRRRSPLHPPHHPRTPSSSSRGERGRGDGDEGGGRFREETASYDTADTAAADATAMMSCASAGRQYRLLGSSGRRRLVASIGARLAATEVASDTRRRMVKLLYQCDRGYGEGVEEAVAGSSARVDGGAGALWQRDRGDMERSVPDERSTEGVAASVGVGGQRQSLSQTKTK